MSDHSSDENEFEPSDSATKNDDQGSFTIVVFVDNSMQIVPTKWLRGDYCAYPPYKKDDEINKACKNEEIPGKSWNLYRITKTFRSYSKCF